MKRPVRKVVMVESVSWCCGLDEHNHRSEAASANCIERQSRKGKDEQGGKPRYKWDDAKREAILVRVEAGETRASIAREMSLSRTHIGLVVNRAKRMRIRKQVRRECGIDHDTRGT